MKPVRNVALLASALVLVVAIIALFDTRDTDKAGGLSTSMSGLSLHEEQASSVSRGEITRPSHPPRPPEKTPPTPTPQPTQSPQPAPPPAAPDPTVSLKTWPIHMAEQVLVLVNAQRSQAGCGLVHNDDKLQQAATNHSADMANNNYFDHTASDGSSPWERANAAGYSKPTGENIAKGYQDAAAVVDGWMNSPGHRDNILNCASAATGLGVVKAPDGTPYWTQMFGA